MWFTRYVLFKLNLNKHFQRPAKCCIAVVQSAYTLLWTFQMWTHLLLRAIFQGRTTVSTISHMRKLNNRKIRDSPKGTHLPCGRRMSGLVLKHLVLNYWMSSFISTNWPDFPGRKMIWWKLFILLLFLSPHHPIFPFLGPLVFTTPTYLICITQIGSWRRILQIFWVIYLFSSCKWKISKGQRVFVCFSSLGGLMVPWTTLLMTRSASTPRTGISSAGTLKSSVETASHIIQASGILCRASHTQMKAEFPNQDFLSRKRVSQQHSGIDAIWHG